MKCRSDADNPRKIGGVNYSDTGGYPEGRTGRPPFSLQTMLRVHFMQQWFTLSDPGMEEAFFDGPEKRVQSSSWISTPIAASVVERATALP